MKKSQYIKSCIHSFLGALLVFLFTGCKVDVAVLYNSGEVNRLPNEYTYVKSLRHAFRGDSIIIVRKDKTRKNISCENMWGIKYRDGTTFRYYKDQYYLLRQNSSLQIYSQIHSGYKSSSTSYYFSKDLDAEIYSMKWKNIKRQFAFDTCFLRKLENDLKWYQDYSLYDKKHKTYRFVEMYNTCKNTSS